jgi:uncharacterized repeat protein (TIGR04052 family)
MKSQTYLIKLFAFCALLASAAFFQFNTGAAAHEGHKKGHAPATAKRLRNPVEHNTANIDNGKALYETNCAGCHGADGKGAEFNKTAKIKVPDLKSHYAMGLSDGEIFYVITNGIRTSKMPAYKLKMSDRERWQAVHYVKHLGMSEEDHAAMSDGANTQTVALRFKPMVGDKGFACGQSYEGIGTTASKITPTDFRLYVHNVRLIDASGKETPVKLEQDGKWQVDNIALLDFENGTGPCGNGTADTHDFIKGTAPAGNYTGVKFAVGVPFERNHADPAKAPSPLNLTQLFWVWNSGYKFARIEMQTTGLPRGWMLHLGSTGCQPGGSAQTLPTNCNFANRAEITLTNFNVNSDIVVTDLKKLLDGANVDVNQPKTPSGCMSGQGDGDCAPLFANLGLTFAGKESPGQKFFSIEKHSQTASLGKSQGARK